MADARRHHQHQPQAQTPTENAAASSSPCDDGGSKLHSLHPALDAMLRDYFAPGSSALFAYGLHMLLYDCGGGNTWKMDSHIVQLVRVILESFMRRFLRCDSAVDSATPLITLDRLLAMLHQARVTERLASISVDLAVKAVAIRKESKADLAPTSGWTLPPLRWPAELPNSQDEPATVILMTVVEFITMEMLGVTVNLARSLKRRLLQARHMRDAIHQDDELLTMARDGLVTLPTNGELAVQWARRYPRTHAWYQARVKESAWYHQPDEAQSVLNRYLSGELTPGHPYYRRFGIRPVGDGSSFLSRNSLPLTPADMNRDYYEYKPGDFPRSGHVIHSIAFDLIDAKGDAYPCAFEGSLVDGKIEHSVICDRRTEFPLADFNSDGTMVLRDVDSASAFARWTPHKYDQATLTEMRQASIRSQLNLDDWTRHHLLEDAKNLSQERLVGCVIEMQLEVLEHWTKFRMNADPTVTEDEACVAAETTYEQVSMLLTIATKLADRNDEERDIFSFTGLHPPKVIQLFTVAGLQAAFDSAEVRGAWSTRDANVGMPKELLGLIGEYAPVDLPSLPRPADLKPAPRIGFSAEYPFCARSAPSFIENQPCRSPTEPNEPEEHTPSQFKLHNRD